MNRIKLKQSKLFQFIGSTNDIGQVIDGPFSPWETLMVSINNYLNVFKLSY